MEIDYSRLPPHMRDGARRYVEQGIHGGAFFTAVVCNDFIEAFRRADDMNTVAMRDWAAWLHNEAPRGCWGDPHKVQQWHAHNGLAGLPEGATA